MVRCVASTFEPFLITLNMSLKPLESTWGVLCNQVASGVAKI